MSDPILTRARELIADPANWTKHDYARARDGLPTGFYDDDATCFCLLGAVNRAITEKLGLAQVQETICPVSVVEGTDEFKSAHNRLCAALRNSTLGFVADFNDDDDTTHADVLELIDRANA